MPDDDRAKDCKDCNGKLMVTTKQISLWTLFIWLLALAAVWIIWFAPEYIVMGF